MTNILRALLAAVAMLASVPLAASEPVPASPAAVSSELRPFLLGGIQLNEDDHERWSAALLQAGMNAVEVTVYAHQGAWSGPELWFSDQEPAVLAEIRAARRNGLQVVLILRVALDHNYPENRFLWHGLVYPETEADLDLWFERYGAFVQKWARVAEAEGVQVLGIASEMNALLATLPVTEIPELPEYYLDAAKQQELRDLVARNRHLFGEDEKAALGAVEFASLEDFLKRRNRQEQSWARAYTFAGPGEPAVDEDAVAARVDQVNRRRALLRRHWEDLIRDVRGSYRGLLTLAANFDNYHEVAFWHRLDLIGINAYFKLRATLETPLREADLTDAWRQVFTEVEAFREAQKLRQPVVFTELGYTRRRGVTFAPWSSSGFLPMWDDEGDWVLLWSAQPFDAAERALAVRSLFLAWWQDRLPLAGVLYWKLSSRIELQRYEPFMVYLGPEAGDPTFDALTSFAGHIRPLDVPSGAGGGAYSRWFGAISRNDPAAVAELGGSGGDVRIPAGRPPLLHLAVQLGRGPIVRHLVDRGARLRTRDSNGFLALHWSCYQEDPSLVPVLLPPEKVPWDDDLGETPFMKCARLGNVAVMRELLKHRSGRGEPSATVLRLATDQASAEMVELLVDSGVDVDAADSDGVTALHAAARRGDAAIVELLANASETEPRDGNGNQPASYAAYFGKAEAFRRLWRADRGPRANAEGQSLLHHAAHGGSVEILESLLKHGFEVNRGDREGRTPLHFAAMKTHGAAARLLLDHGAALDRTDVRGLTALHLAAERKDADLLQTMIERSDAADFADASGNTPLHYAAAWGRLDNVRLLLAAGARPEVRNQEGETPLDLAEDSGRKRVAEILRGLTESIPDP